MANMNDKTAFQLGIDALSKISHPRKHSEAVETKRVEAASFLAKFRERINRASAFADEEGRQALNKLLEDIRFSDPLSVPEASEDEDLLLEISEEILINVERGDVLSSNEISRIRQLLSVRNSTCRQSK